MPQKKKKTFYINRRVVYVLSGVAVIALWLSFFPPYFVEMTINRAWYTLIAALDSRLLDVIGTIHRRSGFEIQTQLSELPFSRVAAGLCSVWSLSLLLGGYLLVRKRGQTPTLSMLVAGFIVLPFPLIVVSSLVIWLCEALSIGISATAVGLLTNMLAAPLTVLLIASLDALVSFVIRPAVSFEWRFLGWGTPAAVCLICMLWLCFFSNFSNQFIEDRYTVEATRVMEAQLYDRAEVCFNRLSDLQLESADGEIGLAKLAEIRGEVAEVRRLMNKLAIPDQAGRAYAHYWLARDLGLREDKLTIEEEQSLRNHLDYVLDEQPTHVDARALLGRWFVRHEMYRPAVFHLNQVVSKRPELRLRLAEAHDGLGNAAEARRQYRLVRNRYSRVLEDDPSNTDARMYLIVAELKLENFDTAEALIQDAHEQLPDSRYHALLISSLCGRSDQQLSYQPPDFQNALMHLKRAFDIDAGAPEVVQRLAYIAQAEPKSRLIISRWLTDAIDSGTETSLLRFVLGTLCLIEEDFESAVPHFERAHELDPENSAIANNLSYALGQVDPPQLDRALALVDEAIAKGALSAAAMAEYRVSRGLLLLKLERWEEAIIELQESLAVLPNKVAAHEGLVLAYSKINVPDLQAIHSRRIEELSSK